MAGKATAMVEAPLCVVRTAYPDDARALAGLAERTFRDAFGAKNTREDMDAHCAASYGEPIQAREIAAPGIEVVVADLAGELVGYGQLRWERASPCVAAARPAEISRLYVDARWHGRGVAPALMAALVERARARRVDRLWLGVWEHNPRAIAFYRKAGFAVVGEKTFTLGRDVQRDLVLARSLEEAGAEGDRP